MLLIKVSQQKKNCQNTGEKKNQQKSKYCFLSKNHGSLNKFIVIRRQQCQRFSYSFPLAHLQLLEKAAGARSQEPRALQVHNHMLPLGHLNLSSNPGCTPPSPQCPHRHSVVALLELLLLVHNSSGHSWTPFQGSFSRPLVSEDKHKCLFLRGCCNEKPLPPGTGAAATGHVKWWNLFPFPLSLPSTAKILPSDGEIVLNELFCPTIKFAEALPITGESLCYTHPACISLQPQRYNRDRCCGGADLLLSSALPISPQNALIPRSAYTASCREQLVP